MKKNKIVLTILTNAILLICACNSSKKTDVFLPLIHPSEDYVLMALTPEFSVKATNIPINKQYLHLTTGKQFPVVGILRINDKMYRFMGGDYLRNLPISALSSDSCGWNAKYTFLRPNAGWKQEQYDDSNWQNGTGAFGSENNNYPVNSTWSANNIYVRRHISIDNIDVLKENKLYINYTCDDHMNLYCNGNPVFQKNYTPQIESWQLSDNIVNCLHNGDNVIAAQGIDDGGGALLDFGLYVEDKTYTKADTAILKQIDVQTTQTHYIFQCGKVKLQLDFVSPALSDDSNIAGCPVGFVTYQVESKEQQADIEIIFDVDTEWMFGRHSINSSIEDKWRIAKTNDCFYLGMRAEETNYTHKNGHITVSQQLSRNKTNCGVLLFGYNEGNKLQYEGENLSPYWHKNEREMKDIIKYIGDQHQDLKKKCSTIDIQYYEKAIRSKGRKYAEHMILSYRDFMAYHHFVLSPNNALFCFENSLGNVNEVYKCFPTLLFYNRLDWMKGLLSPIFEYSENANWIKKYPPYDMGNYPIVNRQVNTEDRGAEIAANMMIMTLAIVKEDKDFNYAEKHWKVLCQWADYLKEYMTDDSNFSYEFPSGIDEHIVLGWMAYQELLKLK